MVYFVLRLIVKVATRIFYRQISIEHKELIPNQKKKALVIVANHPNTFMDALLIASILPQEIHFLTNGSVFKTNFHKWLLSKLNMIPIFRQKDKNGGSEENEKTFLKCFEHLQAQKSILIFPEGTSIMERKVRPIKTGTARIALGAEHFTNFKTDVEILPIGLNYEAQNYFRSKVHIRIGKPISMKSYQQLSTQNVDNAVRMLTSDIQKELENLTIITEDEQEDELVKNLETIYLHEWEEEIEHFGVKKAYFLAKELTKAVKFFKKEDPNLLSNLEIKLSHYFKILNQEGIHDRNIHSSTAHILKDGFFLFLSFPFYLYGLINHYLSYKLPSIITYKITKDETYFAPLTLCFGILSFVFFYSLQSVLFHNLFNDKFLLILYLISIPISGLFTLFYWGKIRLFKQELRWKKSKKSKRMNEKLHLQRKEIIELIEKAKITFFSIKENN